MVCRYSWMSSQTRQRCLTFTFPLVSWSRLIPFVCCLRVCIQGLSNDDKNLRFWLLSRRIDSQNLASLLVSLNAFETAHKRHCSTVFNNIAERNDDCWLVPDVVDFVNTLTTNCRLTHWSCYYGLLVWFAACMLSIFDALDCVAHPLIDAALVQVIERNTTLKVLDFMGLLASLGCFLKSDKVVASVQRAQSNTYRRCVEAELFYRVILDWVSLERYCVSSWAQ